MADDVDVVDGGTEGTGGGLFDSYLESVPEEHREVVTGFLQDADKNLKGRLEAAAQTEKQWAPYKDIDLSRFQPDQLSENLAWLQQVTEDENAFGEWLDRAARDAGYSKGEAEDLEQLEAEGDLTREQVQQLVSERAAEQTAPLEQRLQAIEAEKAIGGIENEINSTFEAIEADEKIKLTPEQRTIITDLGNEDEGPNWLHTGYARYKQISAAAQREFVEDKIKQPSPAVTTGAAAAFKPTNSWDEAEKAALELARQSRQ